MSRRRFSVDAQWTLRGRCRCATAAGAPRRRSGSVAEGSSAGRCGAMARLGARKAYGVSGRRRRAAAVGSKQGAAPAASARRDAGAQSNFSGGAGPGRLRKRRGCLAGAAASSAASRLGSESDERVGGDKGGQGRSGGLGGSGNFGNAQERAEAGGAARAARARGSRRQVGGAVAAESSGLDSVGSSGVVRGASVSAPTSSRALRAGAQGSSRPQTRLQGLGLERGWALRGRGYTAEIDRGRVREWR
ncbi:hypothetical protein Tco_1020097 [Tanacetum coccineum]|uniref:Uncharacterized protein n=1 Tax=Tanacetum coccineum TaxID=301880 RepID=A0ABQ5G1B5_9ASTR